MSAKDTTSAPYQWTNLKNQYLAALAANIIFLAHGGMNGWLSPALSVLLSENTPLINGPLTNEQISWIGSLNALSGIFGTSIFGFLTVTFGCKRAMLLLTFPATLFWVFIYFGNAYYHLLIARFFQGVTGGGIQSCIILFIGEIANDDIRGRLGSVSHLTRNTGVLAGFIVGMLVDYKTVPLVFVVIPIAFGIWFFFFPNTPQFYFSKGQDKEAEHALKYYKGCTGDSVDENIAIIAEFERLKAIANERKEDEKINLSDFLNKAALKGITNGMTIACLAHISGFLIFISYSSLIFKEVGASKINPNISGISLAVCQLIGTLCTTKFSDSLGRKALMIISLLGSAFGMIMFALYSYLRQTIPGLSTFEWIPVISLSFVIFISSSGIVPLMFLVCLENMPSKIRTQGLTIVNVFLNIVSFTCLKLFPLGIVEIGVHGCMLCLATACTLGSIYIYFALKETKGISLDVLNDDNTQSTDNNSISSSKR